MQGAHKDGTADILAAAAAYAQLTKAIEAYNEAQSKSGLGKAVDPAIVQNLAAANKQATALRENLTKLPGGGMGQRPLRTNSAAENLSGLGEDQQNSLAQAHFARYQAGGRLTPERAAEREYITQYNARERQAKLQVFGNRNSLDAGEREQYVIGKAMLKAEEERTLQKHGLGKYAGSPNGGMSGSLMQTVFSSRSLNMLSALGDGNVMPALQTAAGGGISMLRNMAAGSFGTGGSPLRALFGGGATAANQEGGGEAQAAGDPDVEGAAGKAVEGLKGLLGPMAGMASGLVAAVTGIAALVAGSELLASAMNANAANYRLGLQTSIAGVGGVGNASAHDTWKVVMDKGHDYQYAPSVAFNTARILGENGVTGLHGPAGMGHAMDTTLAFARQANMDPTQVAPLVGKLMQGGGRDALLIDKMFQALQVAAVKANVPLARLVDSLKTLEDTTNGSGISLNGVASLAKDQNAVGMGMNIGSAVAPMMGATGTNAFAMAAMLTGGDMKQFMGAQGDPGKMLNLVGRFARQSSTGTREGDEQMAITLAGTAGVNMTGASRKSQIAMADKMLAGYDWTAHPDELKKLLSSGDNDKKAKDLAGSLVNVKDQKVLDFQYRMDDMANNGFPNLTNAAKALAQHGLAWAEHAAKVMGDAVLHTAEKMDWLTKVIGDIPGLGSLTGDSGPIPSPQPAPFPAGPGGAVTVSQTDYTMHEPGTGGAKVKITGDEARAFTLAAKLSGYSAPTLIGQAYQESTLGTLDMANGGIGQMQRGTLENYYKDTPGMNGKWDTRGSPYANKDYFGKGVSNPYYHKKYDNNNLEQGIFAMGWWDNYNKNTTGAHTLADGLKGYHGLGDGPTAGDTPQGYVDKIGGFANAVDINVTIVPTAHHTAKVTVVKPPKGGRDHHAPPSHRPVAQPRRHS